MEKFKVGDRVLCNIKKEYRSKDKEWVEGVIYKAETTYCLVKGIHAIYMDANFPYFYCNKHLKLIGGSMSKYDELKQRIEAVTGWDKEADDILQEIKCIEGACGRVAIAIDYSNYAACLHIRTYEDYKVSNGYLKNHEEFLNYP